MTAKLAGDFLYVLEKNRTFLSLYFVPTGKLVRALKLPILHIDNFWVNRAQNRLLIGSRGESGQLISISSLRIY